MKKSLLALAIFGAFAGAASAQSSVTIYGRLDVGISSFDTGGNGSKLGVSSGNNSASRIGFKGVEDLGNGLKALFVLENGINADNGTGASTAAFSRKSYVGLKGGFGTVKMGKFNTPVKDMLLKVDTFGATGMVNAVDFISGGGLEQRVGNAISYYTPNFGGFSASVNYVFGEVQGNNSANKRYGAHAAYRNGPLDVEVAYYNKNNTTTTTNGNQSDTVLGGTYDFGVVKLHGLYSERNTDAGYATSATSDVKIQSELVGVTVPFGASKVRAEYIRNKNKNVNNSDSNVWALSYTYDMSKRTRLYATYLATKNDALSELAVDGPGDGNPGQSTGSYAVGVLHFF